MNPRVTVPETWYQKQKRISQQIGLSFPQTVLLTDDLFVQMAKKQRGRKGTVFELTFPKK